MIKLIGKSIPCTLNELNEAFKREPHHGMLFCYDAKDKNYSLSLFHREEEMENDFKTLPIEELMTFRILLNSFRDVIDDTIIKKAQVLGYNDGDISNMLTFLEDPEESKKDIFYFDKFAIETPEGYEQLSYYTETSHNIKTLREALVMGYMLREDEECPLTFNDIDVLYYDNTTNRNEEFEQEAKQKGFKFKSLLN